jgi:hypothetical protein
MLRTFLVPSNVALFDHKLNSRLLALWKSTLDTLKEKLVSHFLKALLPYEL